MGSRTPDLHLIAICLLVLLLPAAVTGQGRRLQFSIQPSQGGTPMVVNGQSVFPFQKPPRVRASFRITNATLHFRVVQPSVATPNRSDVGYPPTTIWPPASERSASQRTKPPHRKMRSASICVFELVNHYSATGKKSSELVLLRRADLAMDDTATATAAAATTAAAAADPRPVRIDLTDRVARWLRKRKQLRLLVDCIGCARGFHVESNNATGQPRIELIMEEDPRCTPTQFCGRLVFWLCDARHSDNLRRRRHRNLSFPRGDPACVNGQGCCKRKLYIDFRALGWDSWIIAPVGYNANYCNGTCSSIPRTPDTFSSHYAYIIDKYRRQKVSGYGEGDDVRPSIGPACCVPTRFRAMSLIYYDKKGQLVKSDVPNMIVDECGCA
ncbi:inhibin beta chain-like [Tropilaelaps mercedesae]|uniref:Inhibin beta chain-like n=1 Tax=Tropilaelaps mercedesae TaxID=418985 RepID=A0A1V9XVS2_9ACAR|nr:inhibin beta chain-like [Tropilaelaps mercedesae]